MVVPSNRARHQNRAKEREIVGLKRYHFDCSSSSQRTHPARVVLQKSEHVGSGASVSSPAMGWISDRECSVFDVVNAYSLQVIPIPKNLDPIKSKLCNQLRSAEIATVKETFYGDYFISRYFRPDYIRTY